MENISGSNADLDVGASEQNRMSVGEKKIMPRRGKQSNPNTEEISEGFVERVSTDEEAPQSGGRITLHLASDGSVDWERTKQGSDEQLIDTITKDPVILEKLSSHPEFADEIGSSSTSSDPTAWQPEEAGFVLDLLDKVEGLIVSRISKQVLGETITMSVASLAFSTTEEEHKLQDPRAAQALNDFLTIDNPKYRNLALLGAAHGASFIRKLKDAIKMQSVNPVQEEPETKSNKPNGAVINMKPIERSEEEVARQ